MTETRVWGKADMPKKQQTPAAQAPAQQSGLCLVTIVITLALIAVIAALALLSDSG